MSAYDSISLYDFSLLEYDGGTLSLSSGADVKIGDYEFMLDETIDAGSAVGNLYRPHYRYTSNSMFQQKLGIPGADNKDNLRSERLLWYFDDWSGGEGNRIWFKDDPTVYDFSYGLNPRIRGQLAGRPARTLSTF